MIIDKLSDHCYSKRLHLSFLGQVRLFVLYTANRASRYCIFLDSLEKNKDHGKNTLIYNEYERKCGIRNKHK